MDVVLDCEYWDSLKIGFGLIKIGLHHRPKKED